MKLNEVFFATTLTAILSFTIFAQHAFAACSASPSNPNSDPPYGITAQMDASGTKLSGVIQMSFKDMECLKTEDQAINYWGLIVGSGYWGNCSSSAPNAAHASVSIRLSDNKSKSAVKNDAELDDLNLKAFYFDIGTPPVYVPFKDVQEVQKIVLDALKDHIIEAFFKEQFDNPDQVLALDLYLKEFSLLQQANLYPAAPDAGDSEVMFISNIVLAADVVNVD